RGMALMARNASATAMGAGVMTVAVWIGWMAVISAMEHGVIHVSEVSPFFNSAAEAFSISKALELGIPVGITVALSAFLCSAGLDLIKHYALRQTLHRAGLLPWRLHEFLDYSVRLLLLRKWAVGMRSCTGLSAMYWRRLLGTPPWSVADKRPRRADDDR